MYIVPEPKVRSKAFGTQKVKYILLSISNIEKLTFGESLEGSDGIGIPDVLR